MSAFPQDQSPISTTVVPQTSINDRLLACRRDFLSYFRRRLSRPEDAEDAFQDFCLKVVRTAGKLEDEEKIDAWLGRIMRNTLIDHYRRRAAQQRGEAAYEREPQVTALDVQAEHGPKVCRCVREALPGLRPDYAEILKRADLDEQPRERIAAELALTRNNVGVRLYRARQALKAKIKEICPTCGDGGFEHCECETESRRASA